MQARLVWAQSSIPFNGMYEERCEGCAIGEETSALRCTCSDAGMASGVGAKAFYDGFVRSFLFLFIYIHVMQGLPRYAGLADLWGAGSWFVQLR